MYLRGYGWTSLGVWCGGRGSICLFWVGRCSRSSAAPGARFSPTSSPTGPLTTRDRGERDGAVVPHALRHTRTCPAATPPMLSVRSHMLFVLLCPMRITACLCTDGQGSGHDFYGTLYTPPIGWRNNTDGGRAVLFPDYKQA